MSDGLKETGKRHEVSASAGYEPPRVEQVLTAAQLESEVLYAGLITQDNLQ
jgi:hypothetical protein